MVLVMTNEDVIGSAGTREEKEQRGKKLRGFNKGALNTAEQVDVGMRAHKQMGQLYSGIFWDT